jgi:hypothetical protein
MPHCGCPKPRQTAAWSLDRCPEATGAAGLALGVKRPESLQRCDGWRGQDIGVGAKQFLVDQQVMR